MFGVLLSLRRFMVLAQNACKRRRTGDTQGEDATAPPSSKATPAPSATPAGPASLGSEPWGFEKIKVCAVLRSRDVPLPGPALRL